MPLKTILLALLGLAFAAPALNAQSSTPPPVAIAAPAAVAVNLHRITRDLKSTAENCKSNGNFGAQLWLIADESFFAAWRKFETPQLDPLGIAIRGQPLYTAIVVYGPTRDLKGYSEVAYDLVVRRPDGSVYEERKNLPGYEGTVTDDRLLILGKSYLNISLTPADPAGKYTVEATITDGISKATLSLRQTFTVQ